MTKDRPTIRCYNKPSIPDPVQARLTAEGTFLADYDSGWSLSSAQVPNPDNRPAAGNAFNRVMEVSRLGGLGLIRTPNDADEIITVGEWRPNCATFREINGRELKGVQMSRYGLVTPEDQSFDELDDLYSGGGATVDVITGSESLLLDTLNELDREGRLRGPITP